MSQLKNNWYIGKKCEIEKAQKCNDDEKEKNIIRYFNGTKSGYQEHDLGVSIFKDGAISIYEKDLYSEMCVYLYPEQAKLLRKLLLNNKSRRKK